MRTPPPRTGVLTTARAASLVAWAAALLLGAALILAPDARDAAAQTPTVDYDDDDDGLIEVRTTGQLFAIRQDLNGDGAPDATADVTNYNGAFPNRVTLALGRMGCPTSGGCTGYELDNDLNFDENRDGRITSADSAFWNSGAGWQPITNLAGTASYNATFEGNGYTISYLYINRTLANTALFRSLASGKEIRNVGVKHAAVYHAATTATSIRYAVLVAWNHGTITKSYATGVVVGGNGHVGGLVGRNDGTVRASYAIVEVTTRLGENVPQPGGGFVRQPTCRVETLRRDGCGGLVGRNTGTITASWSAGKVDSQNPNGLASGTGAATNSYWDTQTSGRTNSTLGTGQTTRALQRPTGYSGIYANWNLNLDGNAGGDDPWDFGTNREYPALKYTGRNLKDQRGAYWIEADHWGAPVVGEPIVAYYDSRRRHLEPLRPDGRRAVADHLRRAGGLHQAAVGLAALRQRAHRLDGRSPRPASRRPGPAPSSTSRRRRTSASTCAPACRAGSTATAARSIPRPSSRRSAATAATATFASGNTSPDGGHGHRDLGAAQTAHGPHRVALAALHGERRHRLHAARAGGRQIQLDVPARRRRRGQLPARVRLLLGQQRGVDARGDRLHRRRRRRQLARAAAPRPARRPLVESAGGPRGPRLRAVGVA